MTPTEMAQAYADGKTLAEIATMAGIDRRTVSKRVRAAGGKIRTRSERMRGARNPGWKGGRRYNDGYVMLRVDGRYVLENRLVMEEHMGRALLPGEVVHHKNGIRDDNRVENLEVFQCNAEHLREHVVTAWSRKHSCCVTCGTTKRKHASRGQCVNCYQKQRDIKARGYAATYDANGRRIFSAEHRARLSEAAYRRYHGKKFKKCCQRAR